IRSVMVVHLSMVFSSATHWSDYYPARLAKGWRFAVLVMLSPLSVWVPSGRLRDDTAGGLIGCAGLAREARRKWAQALADTREAETGQPLSRLMAPLAAELRR